MFNMIKKIKKQKKNLKIPKTVQQTIPYEMVYPDGVIEIKPQYFSKSYYFGDANFKGESNVKQRQMFEDYGLLINRFASNICIQISIYNRSMDTVMLKDKFMLKPKKDGYQNFRTEINQDRFAKLSKGRNNLKKERYITVTIEDTDLSSALSMFKNIDIDIEEAMRNINKTGVKALSLYERLEILYELYNPFTELRFADKVRDYMTDGDLDLIALNKRGITSKDLIGCDSITVKSDYIKLGDTYAKSFFLDNLPSFLNTDIFIGLTDVPCNMISSVIYRTIPQDKALKQIKNMSTNINAEVVKLEKNAARSGYSPNLISPELRRTSEDAENLINEVVSRNQKIIFTTVMVTIFEKDPEELQFKTNQLITKANDYLCQIRKLTGQQMAGLNSSLPLGHLYIDIDRILTTESASVFFPFSMQDIMETDGVCYGINTISQNIIFINRASAVLGHALIVGQSRSGKSFLAKMEMINHFVNSNDDILIIDPENEYLSVAEALKGQVIKIKNGTNTHINPLDMDVNYADDDGDPVAMKCDALVAICETIVGKNIGLTPYDINIIQRCGKLIYADYMDYMDSIKNTGVTCDRNAVPTLIDFYDVLLQQPEAEAKRLAMSLEVYCVGNYDVFAHRTNVDVLSRFLVYNIKDIGTGNKELGMQICLNDIWNRIIANKAKGKRTWVYLDEFYLLTQTNSSGRMLQEYFKRAGKWGGIITGITQDVEDVLVTPEARGIFNNCGFCFMFNQSEIGRNELAALYEISENMLTYIKDKPPGTGLIYNGYTIIPFENQFPKDTQLYRIMNTKASDFMES